MSPRPGRIHAEIGIDAPRPRADSFRGTAEFAAHSARLSEMLGAVMQEAVE
jgi:ABC-type nitrate/sulfonate/bicarbonate transport system ATPase subunit